MSSFIFIYVWSIGSLVSSVLKLNSKSSAQQSAQFALGIVTVKSAESYLYDAAIPVVSYSAMNYKASFVTTLAIISSPQITAISSGFISVFPRRSTNGKLC